MIDGLTSIHRWLAIPLAPFFAMWFASGIVMHFVPFPSLTEAERIAGLAPIDLASVAHGPAEAVQASRSTDATRVRLIERSDGPVYVVSSSAGVVALRAADLSSAAVHAAALAGTIAADHARRRGLDPHAVGVAEPVVRDQWTVAGDLDRHRPLYRVALNDAAGTELYVSSATGEVVRDTTRRERWWNALGSIPHWIYVTALRERPGLWTAVLWTLSLAGTLAALAGSLLGIMRISRQNAGLVSPYRDWHAWHHWGGLVCMTFVLTWIFSGWLSMDDGRLFPGARLTADEAATLAGPPEAWPRAQPRFIGEPAKEIAWFRLNGILYQRDRLDLQHQHLVVATADAPTPASHPDDLTPREMSALAQRLSPRCVTSVVDPDTDAYAATTPMPGAPIYRVACGEVWFDIDGAGGAVMQRLDASQRAYRWLYRAPHTLDVPALTAHPALRSALIVVLCGCGLAFSLTGCVIAWRRLGQWLRALAHRAG